VASVHLIETVVGVKGMSMVVAGSTRGGAENTKFALLTVSAFVALVTWSLSAAAITSLPALLTVTTALICPELLVMPVVGVMTTVLPFFEAKLNATPGIGVPAESLRLKVSVAAAPNATELFPLTVMVVPVTSTLLVVVAESALAVTVMVRLILLVPRLSLAVATPLTSDGPLTLLMYAVASLPGVKVTVLPWTVCLFASSTTAVRSIVVAPEEGICGLLTSS